MKNKLKENKIKVLFAASELASLAKVGGLGDVIESLPKALQKNGVDVRVIIPRYKTISLKNLKLIRKLSVLVGEEEEEVLVYKTNVPGTSIALYLLDNNKYLSGGGIYFDKSAFVTEFLEIERFLFFSLATVEFLKNNIFNPDVVHCHDWHTGYILHLIKKQGLGLETVFTIHNIANQGIWNYQEVFNFLFRVENNISDFYISKKNINLMAEGVINSDVLTTVSPRYAQEIKTKEYGEKIENIIKKKKSVQGIINGIDYDFFNPQKNRNIHHFSKSNLAGKLKNKFFLQSKFNLKKGADIPVLSAVSRLTKQKGIDLLPKIIGKLIKKYSCQLIILGTGQEKIENSLLKLQKKYPENIAVANLFSEKSANQIYAGSDIILIPSRFEPCGLTQMIANAYGTIPVVRKTGGLSDTINPYKNKNGQVFGNGFIFNKFDADEFFKATDRALYIFKNKKSDWQKLIKNAMQKDFSWDSSSKKYISLYKDILK